MKQTIADRLRATRERAGLSRIELSRLAGLAGGYVGMLESGERKEPGLNVLVALSETIGASLDWLACGGGDPPTDEMIAAAVDAARKKTAPEQATGTEG